MDQQLDLLHETEWDLLLVLDACRWDIWNEQIGKGWPVSSPACHTKTWIREFLEYDWSDTVCLTANPVITRETDGQFRRFDDVGARKWTRVNDIPTVPPDDMVETIRTYLTLTDAPIYAHLVQPHFPYPKAGIYLRGCRPEPDTDDMVKHIRNTDLTWDDIRDAYRENLRWAYDAIRPLVESNSLTTVVTSDHGELLGEDDRFGHWPRWADDDLLTTVPYHVS